MKIHNADTRQEIEDLGLFLTLDEAKNMRNALATLLNSYGKQEARLRMNDNNYEIIAELEKDTSDFSLEGGARQLKFCISETFPHQSAHTHVDEFIGPYIGDWRRSGPIYPTDVPHT
jgi:hypothetical protein